MRSWLGIIAVVLVGSTATGCGGDSDDAATSATAPGSVAVECEPGEGCPISREQFGDDWPFTVDSGVLGCGLVDGAPEVGSVVFEADGAGGKFYAVNGVAEGMAQEQGWFPLDEIWADDPDTAQYDGKVSIQPIIALGLSICA